MIHSLHLKNFTAFQEATLRFGKNLTVIVGENGTGKTHLLKLPYAILASMWEEGRKHGAQAPTRANLQPRLAEKLTNVFRPESLGRQVRRRSGREGCVVQLSFNNDTPDVSLRFSSRSRTEVNLAVLPQAWIESAPVFLPPRELLTLYPGFVSVYEGHYLELDEVWRDTCVLLGAPLLKPNGDRSMAALLAPLEAAMGGSLELDTNGRFYLRTPEDRLEITLVAEGHRKLAMLARLIATGVPDARSCLFWDEPEANLNPRMMRKVAASVVGLCRAGVQIILATHSLFFLRELEMLLSPSEGALDVQFVGLEPTDVGIRVCQGPTPDDMGDIAALQEELAQSDRFCPPPSGGSPAHEFPQLDSGVEINMERGRPARYSRGADGTPTLL